MQILGGALAPGKRLRIALNIIFILLISSVAILESEHRSIAIALLCVGIIALVVNLRSKDPSEET